MDEVISCEEELLSKHRKEKKDLQAEIQKLKKSVSKGDKKRKKEVTEEIAKLEADLTKRQEEEIANFQSAEKEDENQTDIDKKEAENGIDIGDKEEANMMYVETQKKTSKSQKRKNKREATDRERDRLVQQQALENLQGPRHQELAAVTQMLKDLNLALHEIPADGNCMYNAIGHQLALRDVKYSCEELREMTAKYMRSNPDEFLPFLTHPDTGDMLTPDQFEAYCDKTAKKPVWGGQVELRAMSETLKMPIQVLQAGVQPLLIGETRKAAPITVVYQRHAYRLGEHYNSVAPKSTTDVEDDTEQTLEHQEGND